MNLRKFISGVSALAIAASAFAGMAVTASAAADSNGYDVIFGTSSSSGVTPQTEFTTDNGTYDTQQGAVSPYYLEGSYLAGNQSGGRNYNFSAPITEGVVVFKTYIQSYAATQAKYFFNITAKNSADETINLVRSAYSLNRDTKAAGEQNIITVGDKVINNTSQVYTPRGKVYGYEVTIDLDNKTISYSVAYPTAGSSSVPSKYAVQTGTETLSSDIVSIVGLEVPRHGDNQGFGFDSVSFYAAPPAATSLVKTYKSGETTIGTTTETLTNLYSGTTYTYGIPAYIDYEGTLYQNTASSNTASTTLVGGVNSISATSYTATDYDVYQFVDFDGTKPYNNASKYSNGTGITGSSGESKAVCTVAEDGIYTAYVMAGGYANDNERTGYLTVNGDNAGAVIYNRDGKLNEIPDLTLRRGDAIAVTIGRGVSSLLDYVLLVKTDDIPATQDDKGFTFTSTLNAVQALKVYVTKTESGETKTSDGISISELCETKFEGEGNLLFAVILENIPASWSDISVKVAE